MRTEYVIRDGRGNTRRLDTWEQVLALRSEMEQTIIDRYPFVISIIAVNDLGFEHWTTNDPDTNGGTITSASVVRDFEITDSVLTVESVGISRRMQTEKIQADLAIKLQDNLDRINSYFDYHVEVAQAVQTRRDQQV